MMYVTDKLHQDHQKVEELFQKLKQSGDGAEKGRRDLCDKLKHELLAHTEFENEVFYPAVRNGNGGKELIADAEEEHEQVESMLEEIEAMDPTSGEFMSKLQELEQAVKQHVEMEEREIFPLAKKLIEKQEGEQMSRRHDEMVQQHMSAAGS